MFRPLAAPIVNFEIRSQNRPRARLTSNTGKRNKKHPRARLRAGTLSGLHGGVSGRLLLGHGEWQKDKPWGECREGPQSAKKGGFGFPILEISNSQSVDTTWTSKA
jgi:hypothetical protein